MQHSDKVLIGQSALQVNVGVAYFTFCSIRAFCVMQQEFYGNRRRWPTCHMITIPHSLLPSQTSFCLAQPSLCWFQSRSALSVLVDFSLGFQLTSAPEEMCSESHRACCSVLHWLKLLGVVTFSLKEGLLHGFLSVQHLV